MEETKNIINVQDIEPMMRHQTIFDTFEDLEEGECLVIHNNHDPQPVFYQMMDFYGDMFTWEYLQRGPQWWDVKVTKVSTKEITLKPGEKMIDVPKITDHSLKHQTIFDAFTALSKGESFIIHNDHDPKPVFYQLQGMHGDTFTWEYINQGPQWFDIRVTKTVDKESDKNFAENDELVIDVPSLEPRLKHETIFNAYNNLKEGGSFIIHNDHDPKPVYFQLKALNQTDIFDWEYLQNGPEWFDIRVTKIESGAKPEGPISVNEFGEAVIDIPAIHNHQLKHETIFKVFEHLKPSQSLIIHNDHDPLPVRFQLKQMYGDVFTWEYIEEGPQWWDIRVTLTATNQPNENLEGDEIVIDVPSIEPHSAKHERIFEIFNQLNTGESFIIHNDHDPKPVFYQLQGMHGDIFTWEYLDQGPEVWNIRITMVGTEKQETVGEIVKDDFNKAEIFKKYGIDFCCNGQKTVREACNELGIDHKEVEKELSKVSGNITSSNNLNYDDWNLDFLADYIVNTHHSYVKKNLPEIKKYSAKVTQVHGAHHPELATINELVEQMAAEFYAHMDEEENLLFPIIKKLVKAKNEELEVENPQGLSFEAIIDKHEEEHENVGYALREIRKLSNHYELPSDACASYTLLFKMLEEFEGDTFMHIHLENNILFIKAIELEKELTQ
ncbi:MAG: iron-sulfur cluster repair di-iron protein [Brumimicrobium sp.]